MNTVVYKVTRTSSYCGHSPCSPDSSNATKRASKLQRILMFTESQSLGSFALRPSLWTCHVRQPLASTCSTLRSLTITCAAHALKLCAAHLWPHPQCLFSRHCAYSRFLNFRLKVKRKPTVKSPGTVVDLEHQGDSIKL